MIFTVKQLLHKHGSFVAYIFFGAATTLVNMVVYWLCARFFAEGTIASTIIAWSMAVIFAYVTNRKWVFKSQVNDVHGIMKEVISFFCCRLLTGLLDVIGMYVLVDCLRLNDIIIKFSTNVFVILVNYIASKWVIFKKEQKVCK